MKNIFEQVLIFVGLYCFLFAILGGIASIQHINIITEGNFFFKDDGPNSGGLLLLLIPFLIIYQFSLLKRDFLTFKWRGINKLIVILSFIILVVSTFSLFLIDTNWLIKIASKIRYTSYSSYANFINVEYGFLGALATSSIFAGFCFVFLIYLFKLGIINTGLTIIVVFTNLMGGFPIEISSVFNGIFNTSLSDFGGGCTYFNSFGSIYIF